MKADRRSVPDTCSASPINVDLDLHPSYLLAKRDVLDNIM